MKPEDKYCICTISKTLSDSLKRYLRYLLGVEADSCCFQDVTDKGIKIDFEKYTGTLVEAHEEIRLQGKAFLHNTGIGVFCSLRIKKKLLLKRSKQEHPGTRQRTGILSQAVPFDSCPVVSPRNDLFTNQGIRKSTGVLRQVRGNGT